MLFAPTKAKSVAKPQPLPIIMAAAPETKVQLPLVGQYDEEEQEEQDEQPESEEEQEQEDDEEEEEEEEEQEEEAEEDNEEDEEAQEVDEEEVAENAEGDVEDEDGDEDDEDGEEDDDDDDASEGEDDGTERKKVVKGMSEKKLQKWIETNEKKGVIYMSRIPPFMRPAKVRDLLAPYGEVGRIYLKPEDQSSAYRRKKRGGNKKKKYTEGWVEFADKEVAESVAATLNATPIGDQVRKGSFFHNDLWCMKYLPDFKWRHLTEKKSYENAVRKKRRRTEIQQVKRENNQYLLQVEKAKTHKRLQEKRKRTLAEAGEPVPEVKPDDETSQLEKMRNRFRQRGVSREENEDIDELLPSKKGQHGGPRKRQRVDRKRQAAEDEPVPTGGDVSDDILGQIFGRRN